MWIDSHAHLDVSNYASDRQAVIDRARAAGVELMLEICGSDVGQNSLDAGLHLVDAYPFIYGAIGVHPHEASLYDAALENKLLAMSRHDKIIGWGEIGLDYYYDHSPRDVQRAVFARQLQMGLERRMPVIIHTRDAEEDTIRILKDSWAEVGGKEIGGIIHCFTGTQALADAALEMGFHISFSGVLTFKTAEPLRAVARSVPIDRLLIETDCPFLAPVPYRGKRNEPVYVIETARKLAELKQISLEEIAAQTTANFKRLFSLGI